MLRGLWTLTWLEIKIFMREPLGAFGTIGVPVLLVLVMGRFLGAEARAGSADAARYVSVGLPVLAAVLIAVGEVVSLVTIIAIYREGGILKRLRATPLEPVTILTAHVLVKLLLTVVTLVLVAILARGAIPIALDWRLVRFGVALLIATSSIMALGFVIASVVPTARFAQPVAGFLLWPMVAVSGLFAPLDAMPPALAAIARVLPMTYAVSLLEGIWVGNPWSAHVRDITALLVWLTVCTAVSGKVFRWE